MGQQVKKSTRRWQKSQRPSKGPGGSAGAGKPERPGKKGTAGGKKHRSSRNTGGIKGGLKRGGWLISRWGGAAISPLPNHHDARHLWHPMASCPQAGGPPMTATRRAGRRLLLPRRPRPTACPRTPSWMAGLRTWPQPLAAAAAAAAGRMMMVTAGAEEEQTRRRRRVRSFVQELAAPASRRASMRQPRHEGSTALLHACMNARSCCTPSVPSHACVRSQGGCVRACGCMHASACTPMHASTRLPAHTLVLHLCTSGLHLLCMCSGAAAACTHAQHHARTQA